MKSIFSILVGILVISKSLFADQVELSSSKYETRSWFFNRELSINSPMEVIGYGMDADLSNAILIAKTDIATQIKSNVSSSLTITKSRINDTLESNSNQIQNETSTVTLEEAKVVRQLYREGKWYVAVSYENLPDIKRFVSKLPNKYRSIKFEHNELQNSYFSETIVGKELNKLLPRKIDAKLYWKENTFFLNHGDVYQKLNSDEYSIPELFITFSNSSKNTVKIVKNSKTNGVIISDENCIFGFSSSTHKYVSLFAVNPEGVVLVLENNILITKQTQPYQFFRKNNEERPTMFVSVFSSTPIDNSYFRIMQGNEDRESYGNGKMKFDRFIDFLDGKEFVAQKMLIK